MRRAGLRPGGGPRPFAGLRARASSCARCRRPGSRSRSIAGLTERRCPLCGSPLYGWLKLPDPSTRPTVGRPVEPDAGGRGARPLRGVRGRCRGCGRAGRPRGGGGRLHDRRSRAAAPALAAANRASWQASLGGEGWAAIDVHPGRLLLTPALRCELLAERAGREVEEVRFTVLGRNQRWMWQTLLNGLTFHPNFAREVRAGRLRPATARNRFAFFADCVATVLAAPLVAARVGPAGAGRRARPPGRRDGRAGLRLERSAPRRALASGRRDRAGSMLPDRWRRRGSGAPARRRACPSRAPSTAALATSSTSARRTPARGPRRPRCPPSATNSVFTGPGQTAVSVTPVPASSAWVDLAQREHEGLGRGVDGVAGDRLEGGGRGDVDHGAAAAVDHPGR